MQMQKMFGFDWAINFIVCTYLSKTLLFSKQNIYNDYVIIMKCVPTIFFSKLQLQGKYSSKVFKKILFPLALFIK